MQMTTVANLAAENKAAWNLFARTNRERLRVKVRQVRRDRMTPEGKGRGVAIMPIYHKKINGRKVWWVRVVCRGLNASRVCATKEAAKDAESELRASLRRKVDQAEQAGLAPATVKQLFEAYVADL